MASNEKDLEFAILEKKIKEQLRITSLNQDILRTIGVLDVDGKYNNARALLADASYVGSMVKPVYEFFENTIKVTLPVITCSDDFTDDEKAIYDSMNRVGKTSSEIAGEAGFSKNKTLKLLEGLERKGYVTKIGNGRGTKYLTNA